VPKTSYRCDASRLKTQNTLEVEGSQKPALIAETLALLVPAKGAAKQ
jgi:hypothetical protein